MSGGVDSSVACYLLKKQGYRCIGATIKTWPKEECRNGFYGKRCCSIEAVFSAKNTAETLGIPHYVFDFSDEFMEKVVCYAKEEYSRGRTPNPCILCNSEIKFGLFLRKARILGCDYVASGHYARKVRRTGAKGIYEIKKGLDTEKDQTYFLFNLNQDQLASIIFPLGRLRKEQTRALARKAGLNSHRRASSQDICFTYDKRKGPDGAIYFRGDKVVGRHKGIENYTIGQRKGIGVAYSEPLYVTKIDVRNNALHVGTRSDIYKRCFTADNLNWIGGDPGKRRNIKAKIRYGQKESPCSVFPEPGGAVRVEFDKPQASPTPGQAVVFYDKDTVLGGGWIREIQN